MAAVAAVEHVRWKLHVKGGKAAGQDLQTKKPDYAARDAVD